MINDKLMPDVAESQTANDTIIQIKGLYKNFGKLQVLKGVSTEIKKVFQPR